MNDELVIEQLSEEDARDLTAELREACGEVINWLELAKELAIRAYRGRAWLALGYETWVAYLEAEVPDRPTLTRDQRQSIVAILRAEGLSTRAIAPLVNANHNTVARDIRESSVSSDTDELPERVQSLDGRSRPSTVARREPEAPPQSEMPSEEDMPRSIDVAVSEVVQMLNKVLAVGDTTRRAVEEVARLRGEQLISDELTRDVVRALDGVARRVRELKDQVRR